MNIGKTGTAGEKAAADYLKKKGFKIISQNYQTRYGELDIVCTYKKYIVFAEVKTRSKNYMISGREAVNFSKQRKIIKAALQYMQSYKIDLQPRFDVVEIVICDDKFDISHIENAFTADGFNEYF